MRWVSQLSQFHFSIKYRPGKSNASADALSRQESHEDIMQELTKSTSLHNVTMTRHTRADIRSLTATEESKVTTTLPGYTSEEIASSQMRDPIISSFARKWRYGTKPTYRGLKREPNAVWALVRRWDRMEERQGVLYVKFHDPLEGDHYQLLLPAELRPKVLEALHNRAGHQGQERTLALLQKRCWWPGMSADVERWCKSCETCTVSKAPTPKVRPTMGSLIAEKPLDILAIDFTQLEKSSDGRENVLVMTDVFSKFTQAVPCRDQKSSTVAKALIREWFQKYGVPRRIHSDQGRNFESQLVKDLCAEYTVSQRAGCHRTIPRATGSVKDSTALCTTCYAPYLLTNRNTGPTICRN